MFELTLKLEDSGAALSRLDSLSKMAFPEETWWGTQQRLHKLMKDRAASIKRRNISKSTYQWRKAKAARGGRVPTHLGETAPVLHSHKVGMRTGTLLKDLANSLSPGVYEAVSINEQGIDNGLYLYMINAEAFDREYPTRFEKYLVRRGIIEEGLAGVDESQGQSLLDTLSESVKGHLAALWYSNVG